MKENINWHNIGWEETIELLGSDAKNGLSLGKVEKRQLRFGKNKLPEEKALSQFKIFLKQFKSPLIYILMAAGIITLLLGEYTDSIVIFVSVILNTIVGFIQENKSSKALEKLKKVLTVKTIVFREEREEERLAEELVPGDIILLRSGDKVPADARLIESRNLKINESILSGEWISASKTREIVPENTPLADRDNLVYMGTIVEDGEGRAIVINTGVKTEIGKITLLVRETKEEITPYQKKLNHFSKIIGTIIALMCVIIFIEGMLTGGGFVEMFTMSVAVAVASIPEGLPVAMTVILAIGMQKIYKKNGLVRKLAAAETLGATSVIATDKTGTLTEAKMTLAGIYTFFSKGDEEIVLKNAILSCEAFIENPHEAPSDWIIRGMPTERALVFAGARYQLFKNNLEELEEQIDKIPFSSEYKYSASFRKISKTENIIYVKGAPEVILEKSKYLVVNNELVEINEEKRLLLSKKYEELTSKGYRVLGVAYKKTNKLDLKIKKLKEAIEGLVFNGFVFLEDPIRMGAREAIEKCYEAGMKPIIITGDHKLTAKAVANELGFRIRDENILEGKDLEKMSNSEFDKILKKIQIYARVEAKHKLRIVKAWQKRGEIVAMTGDGINDAPALKQADVGVALGSGTEVAKEVSDLVLLTDDFSIIVAAVEEGRAILDNIRKVITYLLSSSFTEVVLVAVSIIAGLPLPITAVQILWVNLIEDGLPNIALAFEAKEKDLMKQKPQSHQTSLLTSEMKIIIFGMGLITDFILLGLFVWLIKSNYEIEYIRTMIFACLAIDSICFVFSCKSLRRNLWHINIFDNKLLNGAWGVGVISLLSAIYISVFNKLLGTVPLPFLAWLTIIGLGVVNVVLIEAVKFYFIVRHETEI